MIAQSLGTMVHTSRRLLDDLRVLKAHTETPSEALSLVQLAEQHQARALEWLERFATRVTAERIAP